MGPEGASPPDAAVDAAAVGIRTPSGSVEVRGDGWRSSVAALEVLDEGLEKRFLEHGYPLQAHHLGKWRIPRGRGQSFDAPASLRASRNGERKPSGRRLNK
jgi:hypothetical protein